MFASLHPFNPRCANSDKHDRAIVASFIDMMTQKVCMQEEPVFLERNPIHAWSNVTTYN